jgi:hypothetical protein
VIALLAITWAVFAFVDRYDVIQPQILLNADFENGLADWTVNGGQDRLHVRAGGIAINGLGAVHTVGVRQIVLRPRGADILRMTASLRHAGVTSGSRPWHAMRLLVVQRDAKGASLWELPHEVAKESGDGPWHRVSVVFALSSRVKSVEIAAVLNQVGGSMNVRDMALAVVSEKAVFRFLRYLLSGAWVLLLFWVAWSLFGIGVRNRIGTSIWNGIHSGAERAGRMLVGALAVIILFGVLAPHTVKLELRGIATAVTSFVSATDKMPTVEGKKPVVPATTTTTIGNLVGAVWTAIHKLGHVALFAVLAVIAALTWINQGWWRLGLCLGIFAITAETLQLLSVDRSSRPLDAGLNLLGVALGLALAAYWESRRDKVIKARDLPNV